MLTDVFMASPRGFCAGVTRAVSIVENTLEQYGAPVYVRHEIVHNRHVVENLRNKGAIFIDSFEEIIDKNRPVIISAHGASPQVFAEANSLKLNLIDATCPLVERVHQQIKKFEAKKAHIVVIGKKNHPEIIGTIGQIMPQTQISIIANQEEAEQISLPENVPIGIVTQTTLAVDEVDEIIKIIKNRFANLLINNRSDVCYATSHRQAAIKDVAQYCDAIVIIGSQNSSNSKQLKQTALNNGVHQAWLVDDAESFDFSLLNDVTKLGISAGASAPEYLVKEFLHHIKDYFPNVKFHDIITVEEHVQFKS